MLELPVDARFRSFLLSALPDVCLEVAVTEFGGTDGSEERNQMPTDSRSDLLNTGAIPQVVIR